MVTIKMMIIFALLSLIITYSVIAYSQGSSWKGIRVEKYHFHHSSFVIGVFLFGYFLPVLKDLFFGIGIGLFISHGLEEHFMNKKPFPGSFFIFITRESD
jgi:hypothetical protein